MFRHAPMLGLAVNTLIALGISSALVPVCRLAALRFGQTARPQAGRWHKQPTPLLGGVAIATTVLTLHLLLGGQSQMPVLVFGAILMFLLGLCDDVVPLKPYSKLVAEIAIASIFVFFGYRLSWSDSLTVDTLLTLVWIVGVTNAFNLLDNMDGLSAGIALIAGSALLATSLWSGLVTAEASYLGVLLGATAGFLVYNFHPASIFMGDSGSLFIGVNLAVLALGPPNEGDAASNVLSIIAGPLFVLLVPIFDTTFVTVSRVLSGRSAVQGGQDHSSHRLVAMGLSERRAVAVLWTLAALGGLLSLAIHEFRNDWTSLIAALFLLAMIIFAVYLSQVRVYPEADDTLLESDRITPFVVHFVYRRRVAEVLLDLCLVSIGYYAAYRLRFEGPDFAMYFPNFLESLPLVLGTQMVALFAVGGYRGVWRHFGLMDGVTFAKGVFLGALGSVCLLVFAYRFENYSRGVFVIYASLLMLLLCGSRASFRLISEFAQRRWTTGSRLVIYGIGGATAVRELLARESVTYRMLGFIDDDPAMARASMQGYPVLGGYSVLESLIVNGAVDIVVVSTPLIDVHRLQALKALCESHQVELSRVNFSLDQLVAAS